MTRIALIHPSRERPEQAFEAMAKWQIRASAEYNIDYYLSLDENDPFLDKYSLINVRGFCGHKVTNHNKSAIDAINMAAQVAFMDMGIDIAVVMSDDFDCPQNWDKLIVEATEGKEDWVLKTSDGMQPWIITLPIMDRKYYDRFGYIYNPIYTHMFCDTELTHVADLLDRKIIDMSIVFPHNHYSTGRFKKDGVSTRADATFHKGEKIYLNRVRANFGLSSDEIVGRCRPDKQSKEWFITKGIKI